MKKIYASLRLAFLLGSLLFAGLSLFPSESGAAYCNPLCGPQGPISCGNSSCRRPE